MATITQGKSFVDTGGRTGVAQFNPNTGARLSPGESVAVGGSTGTNTNVSQGSSGTQSGAPAPSKSLQTGSTGLDVQQLQKYLSDMGYLTPQQITTGPGIYGPQTTAAVAKFQQDYGIQPDTGQGNYGPATQQALTQKYQGLYNTVSGTSVPGNASSANQQLQTYTQTSSDPVFSTLTSSIQPIMSSLNQVLQNINNPAVTGVSLQEEYNNLQQQYGLPSMQADLLNMQNVMNGSEQDVRDELTKSGGTATDSQVMALSAARNKVILKQYNALATQYQAAQTNVQNMMQYAATDQQTAFQRQQATASIVENMSSIETQMMNMGMTMQQRTTDNLNKVVTNVGYSGLAQQAAGNPGLLSYYESSLGLAQGSLSNPQSLKQLETLRQQQIALGQQRVTIQMYNAGLGGGPTSTNSNVPGLYVNNPKGKVGQSIVSTASQGSDSQGRPYSFTSAQGQNLLNNGATQDPGTNNLVVPGIGYYVQQSDGSYRLSIDPQSSEGQYIQYSNRAQNPQPWQPVGSLSNQRMTRNAMTRQANAATTNYVNSPTYKNVSAAATYLVKLNAGLANPGSIGDPETIDSLVKINTGGQGAITEQQYSAYAQGQTWADKFQVVEGKVVAKGGTLSPQQRQEIHSLAQDTINGYMNQYQTIYTQALKNMDNQGIPDAFWGNVPDWNQILQGQLYQPLTDQ